jgi:hypothetical protein
VARRGNRARDFFAPEMKKSRALFREKIRAMKTAREKYLTIL